jgi:hypothetical protein
MEAQTYINWLSEGWPIESWHPSTISTTPLDFVKFVHEHIKHI